MSRPIGAFFHVPHGMSNAMLLPRITEFSIPGCPERYADCAVAMDFAEADASIDVACEQLMKGLYTLCADLQVPSLSAFGVDAARFEALVPTMAQQALASGSPANNPRLPEQQEIEALYREVWA
jgi:alcohol dehydrogenase class IV